jgi:hypothetical protein
MNEKLHEIIDLCLSLEDGVTHAFAYVNTNCNVITVDVWEGDDLSDETRIYSDRAYYDGELKDEKGINNIIQSLGELKENY